jgi:hypothetical protein
MPLQLQLRRGTSTQNDAFTGAVGEITVDTTNRTIRVHDNTTAGGSALVNISASQTLTNKTLTTPSLSSPTITGHATIEGQLLAGATGTGNLVLSAAPALTGNATAVNLSISGSLTVGSVDIKSLSVAMAVALS